MIKNILRNQEKFLNRVKENKGITLIVLVITIIILLILAGITIAVISRR